MFNHIRRVLLHAKLVELVLEGFVNHLIDLVGPVGDNLSDCIVAKWMTDEMHDFFLDA